MKAYVLLLPVLAWIIGCSGAGEKQSVTLPPRSYDVAPDKIIKSIVYTPDGKTLLIAGQDKKIRFMNTENGALIWESAERPDGLLSVAISPDGKYFAATCGDNTQNTAEVVMYSMDTKKELWGKKGLTNDVQYVKFSPDGKTLAVLHYFNIILYDALTGNQTKFFSGHGMDVAAPWGHVDAVTDIEFTADPLKFITVGWDKNVKIWDIEIGHEIKTFPEGDPINTCILSADGRQIITGSNGGLHVWNRETNLTDTMLTVEGDIQAMVSVRNGGYVITGDEKGNLTLWQFPSLAMISNIKNAHQRGIWSLAVSPDGQYVASAGGDGKVTFWQVEYLMQYKPITDSAAVKKDRVK